MTLLSSPAPASTLFERVTEFALFDAAVREARGGSGRLIVLEGEAGIGKSTLVAAAAAAARREGLRVLRTRASELERHYPYGVAVGLFDPMVDVPLAAGDDLFGGAAGVARTLFQRSGPAPQVDGEHAPVGDPFATVHGLYWLTLNTIERGPLLIAVDDAQWSDEGSLRYLHYLSQRIEELPVVLVLAFRTGPSADAKHARAIRSAANATIIEPEPLSDEAIGDLLARAGIPDGDGAVRRRVASITRGNPFFVNELIRQGRGAGSAVSAIADGPVPTTIARFVEARLAVLDPDAHHLAESIAILGEEATSTRVAMLAGLPEERAGDLIRALTRAVVLDHAGPLDFVHPIVRAAVYEAVPAVTRARMHRRAALMLADDSAPTGVVGVQLLEAEATGDPRVVGLLGAAADEALERGQPRETVHLLERALEEPPREDDRTYLLVRLARAYARLQSPDAIRHYSAVMDQIDDPRRRAEILLELGHALVAATDWPGATVAFERGLRALAEAPPRATDRELRERLEAGFASAAWVSVDRRPEAEAVLARLLRETSLSAVHRELAVWVAFQHSIVVGDTAASLSRQVHRAIDGVPAEELMGAGQLVEVAAGVLVTTDDLEGEIDLLTRSIAAAEQAGAFGKVGLYSYCRAFPAYYTGALTDAIADAQNAIRTSDFGWETFMPGARAILAFSLIERGDLDAAAEALNMDPEGWEARIDYALLVPLARGRVALARGDVERAIELFEEAGRLPKAMGLRSLVPPNWRDWMAIALSQSGRRDEARAIAGELVAIGRESGARWTLGSVLRVAGLVEGGSTGIDLLRESSALLEATPAHLERARTRLELGAALRRGGYVRDAREVLAGALDLAHRIGAGAFVARARDELEAAGARPRRYAISGRDLLTPAELRVARLAAEGRTNRHIAQALFVTPKAVEFHLANVYPKLGIASRQELAAALVGPVDGGY